MTAMQQTFRLNDDTAIPAVGFGTYLVSNDDAPEAVSSAISNGYRHIDTAATRRNHTTRQLPNVMQVLQSLGWITPTST